MTEAMVLILFLAMCRYRVEIFVFHAMQKELENHKDMRAVLRAEKREGIKVRLCGGKPISDLMVNTIPILTGGFSFIIQFSMDDNVDTYASATESRTLHLKVVSVRANETKFMLFDIIAPKNWARDINKTIEVHRDGKLYTITGKVSAI